MELIFNQHSIKLNNLLSVEIIIKKINEHLEEEHYLSHLIVDGKEVYEELELYLTDHITQIKEIKVITKTVSEFINDLLLTAEEYLDRAVQEIPLLSNEYYQNPTSVSWNKFAQMLEGIQWLNQTIHSINQTKEQPNNWIDYLNLSGELQSVLMDLENTIENNDSILIADMIQYELLPIFERLKTVIKATIDTEGYRYDLN